MLELLVKRAAALVGRVLSSMMPSIRVAAEAAVEMVVPWRWAEQRDQSNERGLRERPAALCSNGYQDFQTVWLLLQLL
jgi:hypothetical protein